MRTNPYTARFPVIWDCELSGGVGGSLPSIDGQIDGLEIVRKDVGNAPRWEFRHLLPGGKVGVNLGGAFRRVVECGGSRRTPPTAGLHRHQRKVRTPRHTTQRDRKDGAGTCQMVNEHSLTTVKVRAVAVVS